MDVRAARSALEQGDEDKTVRYALSDGPEYEYRVPARSEVPRIAYASCAGFHDLKDMLNVEKKNAMWKVLLERH